MARCGLLRMLGGWGDLLWREWRRGGTYAADAEASLGSGALGKCARAKAVASHRAPHRLPWGEIAEALRVGLGDGRLNRLRINDM
jgi:hypothetical protein